MKARYGVERGSVLSFGTVEVTRVCPKVKGQVMQFRVYELKGKSRGDVADGSDCHMPEWRGVEVKWRMYSPKVTTPPKWREGAVLERPFDEVVKMDFRGLNALMVGGTSE
jgi:hypothetical protein